MDIGLLFILKLVTSRCFWKFTIYSWQFHPSTVDGDDHNDIHPCSDRKAVRGLTHEFSMFNMEKSLSYNQKIWKLDVELGFEWIIEVYFDLVAQIRAWQGKCRRVIIHIVMVHTVLKIIFVCLGPCWSFHVCWWKEIRNRKGHHVQCMKILEQNVTGQCACALKYIL